MRFLLLYIGISVLCSTCSRRPAPLQTGDLLFQVGADSAMSQAITEATGRFDRLDFTHVGILLHGEQADSVLEATGEGGVRIVSLQSFLDGAARIGDRPGVVALRLNDTAGIAQSAARARQACGLPYDYSFRPDNGRYYCSELVWEFFRRPDGTRIFPARPMNFRAPDGTMPPFWQELFERRGEAVPEGVPGTNPNDMAREPILREVFDWSK